MTDRTSGTARPKRAPRPAVARKVNSSAPTTVASVSMTTWSVIKCLTVQTIAMSPSIAELTSASRYGLLWLHIDLLFHSFNSELAVMDGNEWISFNLA